MIKKSYIDTVFLISLGVLSSFSLPPYNYLIINFFTFSAFFVFLFKKSQIIQNKKYFFIYGWLFGFGYFISSLYWISISLTFDQNFKYLIPFTIILIPAQELPKVIRFCTKTYQKIQKLYYKFLREINLLDI